MEWLRVWGQNQKHNPHLEKKSIISANDENQIEDRPKLEWDILDKRLGILNNSRNKRRPAEAWSKKSTAAVPRGGQGPKKKLRQCPAEPRSVNIGRGGPCWGGVKIMLLGRSPPPGRYK